MQRESFTARLLNVASAPLCDHKPTLSSALLDRCAPQLVREYLDLLGERNGFFAFESALHVFPAGRTASGYDVERWNDLKGWTAGYDGLATDSLFFAEDIFGEQFAIKGDAIYRFDPEGGSYTFIAKSIDGWSQLILEDYHTETGYVLAHEWQARNGALEANKRLVPITPFVLGGEYSVDNLFASDAMRGMQLRADIWRQIKDLPPGAKVEIRLTE